jgi:xanthine dehydrogenase accessory factor
LARKTSYIIDMTSYTVLTTPLDGVLRGLTRDGVPGTARTRVIEVGPRGPAAIVTGLGECPRRIAQEVLQAVQH